MDLGRIPVGIGRFAVVFGFGLSPLFIGCAGKSERHGDENGDGGSGATGRGGSGKGGSGKGGSGKGGSGKGGSPTGGSSTGGSPNIGVQSITQDSVDKIDLLFMVDNSISMADKQRTLAEAVPVLVQRLVDPICIDATGAPAGGTYSTGCAAGTQPEFRPIKDIHIGVITSSLGNHGGDVCLPDVNDPSRTPNDAAQLVASVRTGLYSYQNQGFLVWDPRMGAERPEVDRHPGVTSHEQVVNEFVADFSAQVTAAGERGCGYEASLESWYRFLIDPEPISQVTVDGSGQFSVRGPINQVVLAQRATFLRPDSLLAIVMLTDENDCSISDENYQQGWLTGRRISMPRGSDACSHPEDPNVYRCCMPCVLLDAPGFEPPSGCNYGADVACGSGHSLTPIEDSTNLRCFAQARRFGLDFLYPWQRYVEGLTSPRIELRAPNASGSSEVTNPIYAPGIDGTPAREPYLVFLVGIVGVPWQDLADEASLRGRGLRYLNAQEMNAVAPNRWEVILGDPDLGRQPLDPFMIESIDERPAGAANPVPGVSASIAPSSATGQTNPINGHEQNIVNRDDLQYACTFDLEPDVPCTTANQDGCDCNQSEQPYNRSLCLYGGARDGTQTHAKAYPGIRHLQVLKGFGDNSVVASICPKNVQPNGDAVTDPDYGYNPAVAAMVARFRVALGMRCLPRPLTVDENGQTACAIVEAQFPTGGDFCSCDAPGRRPLPVTDPNGSAARAGLVDRALCGGDTGVSCDDYCLCEIQQLSGSALDACLRTTTDPGNVSGFCYVEPDRGQGVPGLVAGCPATQRQLIRFMGDDLPAKNAQTFISCTDGAL